MKSIFQLASAGVLSLALTAPVFSQQLQQPAVQPTTKPATRDTGIGPQLKQEPATAAPQVPANPGQRPQSTSPISSTGPANETPAARPTRQQAPANPLGPVVQVIDPAGVPLNGYIQVAPNRVYDPVTNRYYWTTPAGERQKIVK